MHIKCCTRLCTSHSVSTDGCYKCPFASWAGTLTKKGDSIEWVVLAQVSSPAARPWRTLADHRRIERKKERNEREREKKQSVPRKMAPAWVAFSVLAASGISEEGEWVSEWLRDDSFCLRTSGQRRNGEKIQILGKKFPVRRSPLSFLLRHKLPPRSLSLAPSCLLLFAPFLANKQQHSRSTAAFSAAPEIEWERKRNGRRKFQRDGVSLERPKLNSRSFWATSGNSRRPSRYLHPHLFAAAVFKTLFRVACYTEARHSQCTYCTRYGALIPSHQTESLDKFNIWNFSFLLFQNKRLSIVSKRMWYT